MKFKSDFLSSLASLQYVAIESNKGATTLQPTQVPYLSLPPPTPNAFTPTSPPAFKNVKGDETAVGEGGDIKALTVRVSLD